MMASANWNDVRAFEYRQILASSSARPATHVSGRWIETLTTTDQPRQSLFQRLASRLSSGSARPATTSDQGERSFRDGTRPVIRWIKGDGLDDPVTRTAIAQATRMFGDTVDYCLCTTGLSASRVRRLLAWATEPVEWIPLGSEHNIELAHALARAGCGVDQFGYWWKWFPERVRPNAPEWILDGDMALTGAPDWFDAWKKGSDPLRVSQDDRWPEDELYGEYLPLVDLDLRLYSGLISLPPGLRYMPAFLDVLAEQPLAAGHNGCLNMSEQGVVATAFTRLRAQPIPLSEFPFGRAFEEAIDFGLKGPAQNIWGYHFGWAFRGRNKHFERLCEEKTLFTIAGAQPIAEQFAWLRNSGQWGRPGWSMHPICVRRIRELAERHAGLPTLEIGTSRGHLTAHLASCGCLVTTIDHADRNARQNLDGMGVEFVIDDVIDYLGRETRTFDFVVVDLHGNDEAVWRRLWPRLAPRLSSRGTMVLYNSHLWKIDEFSNQTGLRWLAQTQLSGFAVQTHEEPPPGMLVCTHV